MMFQINALRFNQSTAGAGRTSSKSTRMLISGCPAASAALGKQKVKLDPTCINFSPSAKIAASLCKRDFLPFALFQR